MLRAFAASVPWSVPLLLAAVFGATEFASGYRPELTLLAVPWVTIAATLLASWCAYVLARRRGRMEAASLATTVFLMVPAAFGCFLITEEPIIRAGYAAAAVLFLSFYLAYVRGIVRLDPRFTPEDFGHLSFSVHAVTIFFAWYALASLPDYIDLPLAVTAVLMTVVALVLSSETLRRSGLKPPRALRVGLAVAALVGQAFAAISFLPISDAAGTAAGTVLFVTGMRAIIGQLAAAAPSPIGPIRRQLAFSLVLITIVFTTARWT